MEINFSFYDFSVLGGVTTITVPMYHSLLGCRAYCNALVLLNCWLLLFFSFGGGVAVLKGTVLSRISRAGYYIILIS